MSKASFMNALVDAASRPYRHAGRFPWHFARGKLRADPAFAAMLKMGLIPDGRLLDVGSGQGLLAAWVLAARQMHEGGSWPAGWPEPPRLSAFRGVELVSRDVKWARLALGERAEFVQGDMRRADFGQADAVVILDVLHYVDCAAQDDVLRRARAALAPGGVLLMRVGAAEGGLPFLFSKFIDGLIFFARSGCMARFHCRTSGDWRKALEQLGFSVDAFPMDSGTPFANVLLAARI